ncbi:prepilin-type cleavage/methylation domain-containing protein [Chroococcidiopsis sp. CCALA 051]|uniref:PulJ/GspJ family protein n=1 Tax=Chroococcidiopsis sp. CCALA 051 TaxID=869949 RepID=UPI000D0DE51B|nr:prepilin-type N-terminal cleavage/methylation domain-containing protein [Chroococcidiopsis sp. CCALA 051]MBE9014644.1 prepilin-type N-terminal cleavage/methylation domain-containing protein [Chroococcidiopsidales cyanobacterium LEGE 13417]PSM47552.1 prepilin-type cleavage/methylation domain-containing protein [Chroococcidiopsis sp. CCALA 051]
MSYMKQYFARIYRRFHIPQPSRGFTLVELLIAVLISTMVIVIAGFALVTITSFDNKAEAKTERQIDLNRAFDFMTHEIRMASRINRLDTEVADSSTITLEKIVEDAGIKTKLGSYGTIALYLEIPITNIPPACPPPTASYTVPADYQAGYDKVVYDIRPTTGSWLNPKVIARYGRIPNTDGSIDPCKNPVASDILVDSISDTDINPTCASPAVKFGAGGFYACVDGSLVELFLRGAVSSTENQDVTGRAFSRLSSYSTELAPVLSGSKSGTTEMNLTWTWSGTGNPTYKVYRTVDGVATEVYSGSASHLDSSTTPSLRPTSGKQNCYTVRATIGSYTSAPSNARCEDF